MNTEKFIKEIESHNYNYSRLQEILRNDEFSIDMFKNHFKYAEILSKIVSVNFGLGIVSLIKAGFEFSIVDQSTGFTPLMIVAAEGLCGPTKALVENVKDENIRYSNIKQNNCNILSLLLNRSHSLCTCLPSLLARLPPNLEWPMNTIMKLSELLCLIKCSIPIKVISTLNFWISCNLLQISTIKEDQKLSGELFIDHISHWNLTVDCNSPENIIKVLLETIKCLIFLGFLDPSIKNELFDTFKISKQCNKLRRKCRFHQFATNDESGIDVRMLKCFCIRQIRTNLQFGMLMSDYKQNSLSFRDHLVPNLMLPTNLKEQIIYSGHY